jgi:hypothetical protein
LVARVVWFDCVAVNMHCPPWQEGLLTSASRIAVIWVLVLFHLFTYWYFDKIVYRYWWWYVVFTFLNTYLLIPLVLYVAILVNKCNTHIDLLLIVLHVCMY